tara:strand:+ start:21 stop:500 length:480 start_codon:yes stop_codon:yes gene_type:complete
MVDDMANKKHTTESSTEDSRPRKTREELLAERREKRIDLGSFRNVMSTPNIPGKRFYWQNDHIKGGLNAVDRLLRLGWEIYTGDFEVADEMAVERDVDLGGAHKIAVGMNGPDPLYAILMVIDEDVYLADQDIKEEEIRAKEDELRNSVNLPGAYGQIG